MTTTFYAISGIGWGRGETLVEARKNYREAQFRNFPNLTEENLEASWGFIWETPDGTTGFENGVEGLYWVFANEEGDANLKDPELSDPRQRIAYLGDVPEQFQTIDLKANTAMHEEG